MSAVITEGVKPTLSELEKFEDQPEGIDLEVVTESTGKEREHNFQPGDNVEVCEGELINLQGKILSVDGNKITIMPKHEDLKDMLEFPAQELRKYFKMGDHVKVIAGRFEGDTGLIVRVEENFVILFSDLTMHELKVLPGTCNSARRRHRVWMLGASTSGGSWCSWTPRLWVSLCDWSGDLPGAEHVWEGGDCQAPGCDPEEGQPLCRGPGLRTEQHPCERHRQGH